MAQTPQLTDYVAIIIELFDRFRQERNARAGAKLDHDLCDGNDENGRLRATAVNHGESLESRGITVRMSASKSQWRWLRKHPEFVETPGWIPHVTTIVRRDMRLYDLLQAFVLFTAQHTFCPLVP